MDPNVKKTTLRMIPYGLYVLTAAHSDGRISAGTVNWVTQASFEPPLVASRYFGVAALADCAEGTGTLAKLRPPFASNAWFGSLWSGRMPVPLGGKSFEKTEVPPG